MHDTAKRSAIQGLLQKRSGRAVVFDYGNVLCLEQTLEDMKGMALVCGIPHERFSGLSSVVTQNRPMRVTSKPANEKARGIDSDGSPYRLLRYEQCLERSEETTSFGTREARMALAAHRASHWCTSRNSRRLPEGGGDRGTTTGWLGTASTGKTGQRGDHRPR